MVTFKLTEKSVDANNSTYNEALGYVQTENGIISTDLAKKIDAFTRAVCALTTNTYSDATLTTTYSVNQIIIDGGEE